MNTWKTANAPLEDPGAGVELRVRTYVGGWAW